MLRDSSTRDNPYMLFGDLHRPIQRFYDFIPALEYIFDLAVRFHDNLPTVLIFCQLSTNQNLIQQFEGFWVSDTIGRIPRIRTLLYNSWKAWNKKNRKWIFVVQSGNELGQAQPKLGSGLKWDLVDSICLFPMFLFYPIDWLFTLIYIAKYNNLEIYLRYLFNFILISI